MARAFSLALFLLLGPLGALWGVVRELAAIFLALRGSCDALAHDISRRGHLVFLLRNPLGVFDLARAAHLVRLSRRIYFARKICCRNRSFALTPHAQKSTGRAQKQKNHLRARAYYLTAASANFKVFGNL